MRNPGICFLLGLSALATGLAADGQNVQEPIVEHRKLSDWLRDYQRSIPKPERNGDPEMRRRAEAAVRIVGTNAMPWLLEELGAKEAPAGSELRQNYYQGQAISRRWLAADAFEILGPTAKNATPALIRLLDDPQTSYTAARALGGIGTESIPALTQALTNANPTARESAVRVLGSFGSKAHSAVPDILRCTNDPNKSVRTFALFALKQIDPQAAATLPAK